MNVDEQSTCITFIKPFLLQLQLASRWAGKLPHGAKLSPEAMQFSSTSGFGKNVKTQWKSAKWEIRHLTKIVKLWLGILCQFFTGVTVCYSSRHTHLIDLRRLYRFAVARPSFSDSPRLTDRPWPPWYSHRNSWVQSKNWAPSKRSTGYVWSPLCAT